jgi:hypothetical protein
MPLKCGLFISLLITAITVARAQSSTILTGNVTRKESGPLAMVSVILLKDTSFLAAGITNEKGDFSINAPLQKDTTYILQLSLVGFQTMTQPFRFPDTALSKKLVLTIEGNTLKDVVILSSKQIITRKADRYVINVENSYLANAGNGLDVLQRSRGLWVNTDGSIRLKGNQPVMVMINDVVQRMSPEELAEYLKSLASESISKIEVIQNPRPNMRQPEQAALCISF